MDRLIAAPAPRRPLPPRCATAIVLLLSLHLGAAEGPALPDLIRRAQAAVQAARWTDAADDFALAIRLADRTPGISASYAADLRILGGIAAAQAGRDQQARMLLTEGLRSTPGKHRERGLRELILVLGRLGAVDEAGAWIDHWQSGAPAPDPARPLPSTAPAPAAPAGRRDHARWSGLLMGIRGHDTNPTLAPYRPADPMLPDSESDESLFVVGTATLTSADRRWSGSFTAMEQRYDATPTSDYQALLLAGRWRDEADRPAWMAELTATREWIDGRHYADRLRADGTADWRPSDGWALRSGLSAEAIAREDRDVGSVVGLDQRIEWEASPTGWRFQLGGGAGYSRMREPRDRWDEARGMAAVRLPTFLGTSIELTAKGSIRGYDLRRGDDPEETRVDRSIDLGATAWLPVADHLGLWANATFHGRDSNEDIYDTQRQTVALGVMTWW